MPEFEWTNLHGVSCIVWLANTTQDDLTKKTRQVLKKRKTDLGNSNPDIPILDVCFRHGHKEYCDIIIHSENVNEWEQQLKMCFKPKVYTLVTKTAKTARQMVVKKNNEDILVIHFYYKQSKLMIQPGNSKEKNLLDFIKIIPSIRNLPHGENDNADETQSRIASQLENMETSKKFGIHNIYNTTPVGNGKSVSDDHVPACQLTVNIPPPKQQVAHAKKSSSNVSDDNVSIESTSSTGNATREYIADVNHKQFLSVEAGEETDGNSVDTTTITLDASSQTTSSVHIDELLCFVQNRMLTGPSDFISKLCTDFYSDDTIKHSKSLLFQHTVGIRPDKLRHIKRVGGNSKSQNLVDIMNVFRSLPVRNSPTFVAKDLSKLPPLSAFDNDVISLHREVEELKSGLQVMLEVRNDIGELTKSVQNLHISDTRHQPACQTSTRVASTSVATVCRRDIARAEPPVTIKMPSCTGDDQAASVVHQAYQDSSECSDGLAAAGKRKDDATNSHVDNGDLAITVRREMDDELSSDDTDNDTSDSGQYIVLDTISEDEDDAGFQEVRAKKANYSRQDNSYFKSKSDKHNGNTIVGSGHSSNFKVASQRYKSRDSHNPNRYVTGVFITRLAPSTSCAQIAIHVRRETGLAIHPEKITKHDTYCSFYIPANSIQRSTLLDGSIWPKGSLVKPFFT